jgi:hypothetical protein
MLVQRGKAIKDIFRTLGCRNFRLFFIGEGISLIGTWMQRIALPWLLPLGRFSSLRVEKCEEKNP